VLLGGEIDFQGSTMSSSLSGGTSMSTIGATATLPWFSTFRVRAGYPVGSVMPYVTGGAVWGHQRLQGFDSATGSFDASNNFWTYTVGGGVEGRISDGLSAKLEYLWIGTPDTPLSTAGHRQRRPALDRQSGPGRRELSLLRRNSAEPARSLARLWWNDVREHAWSCSRPLSSWPRSAWPPFLVGPTAGAGAMGRVCRRQPAAGLAMMAIANKATAEGRRIHPEQIELAAV
jgi:hypothetical protein